MAHKLPILSDADKVALKHALEKKLYTDSFYEFFVASTKVLYPQVVWDMNWHFNWLCDLFQQQIERNIRKEDKDLGDILINLPFRAGKSILISQILPVYIWVRQPSAAIMQVSHSETLAIKHSHASKMLIESEWFKSYFGDIFTLRIDTHAKANYMNDAGGKRISFGVGSGIIGEGCNYQIIDDINSPSDSKGVTQTINETYTDTLYSRLNDSQRDLRIILQQRVAENDICGFLIKKNPTKYYHICLPAKLSQDIKPKELIPYYEDGLFWKTRFSEKVLDDYRSTLGSRAYAGQLQQRPMVEEGGIIKRDWFKIITTSELTQLLNGKQLMLNIFVDSAYTSKQVNDATGILVAGRLGNSAVIVKAKRVWLEFPELIQELKRLQLQFKTRLIYIEKKASGLSIIQQLRRDGLNVAELSPKDQDKLTRVNAATPNMEGGRVMLLEDESNETLLSELSSFPFGADDLTDCVTYMVNTFLDKNNSMHYKIG
jgi:predicted phage terminase large subunit-like protein